MPKPVKSNGRPHYDQIRTYQRELERMRDLEEPLVIRAAIVRELDRLLAEQIAWKAKHWGDTH